MFYWLSELLTKLPEPARSWLSTARVLHYITVRAFLGAATAFLLSVWLGPWLIRRLRALQFHQVVRRGDAPALDALHGHKEGTPTMGGLLIVGALLLSGLLWTAPGNRFVLLTLATTCFMAAVGFWDDVTKIRERHSRGVSARRKFLLECLWSVLVFGVLMWLPETHDRTLRLMVPFLKHPLMDPMPWLLGAVFLTLIVAGATNAVNLTDGLDGLAIGCTGSVALSYLIMAYAAGHAVFADYLLVPYVPGAGELAVLCGCLLGASLGFLWHNCHPAQVFMGDTGSLAIGGTIAMVAILIKQELVLLIVGGVFVMEALSVILQVASFRCRGKRIFAMAPLHHHFELRGWSETQVTIRFWILSIIFALLGVLTLKIR